MNNKKLKIMIYGGFESKNPVHDYFLESFHSTKKRIYTFFDFSLLEIYQRKTIWKIFRKLNDGILEFHRLRHVTSFIKEIKKIEPDIVIIFKGLFLDFNDIEEIKKTGAWTVIINIDDFFSLNRNNWTPQQRRAIAAYDHVFVTKTYNVDEIKPINENVTFFPSPYYPPLHHPMKLDGKDKRKWDMDVVFIGTWEKERAVLLETLVQKVKARYAIYGSQWYKLKPWSPLKKYVFGYNLIGTDMVKAIGNAKICLGFLRKKNRDNHTSRTFEIPACGGVMLGERTDYQKKYFREGKEAEYFESASSEELISKVNLLLQNSSYRESIRRHAILRLKKFKVTYGDFIKVILSCYLKALK